MWDQKSFSFKGLINGKFGTSGMEADRAYMLAIFNTYTLVCQEIIKECMHHVIDVLGYKVILGATDSMYLPAQKKPEFYTDKKGKVHLKEMDELVDIINKLAREFAKREFNMDNVDIFEVEGQDFSDNFFIRNKKFYLKGVVMKDGIMLPKRKVEFKGVKKIRRETAQISEKVQDDLGAIIMANAPVEDALKFLQETHAKFNEIPIMALSKVLPVKQKVDNYQEGSEQWKAFKLGEYFGIDPQVGDRYYVAPVKYCPGKIDGQVVDPALGDVVAFDDDSLANIEAGGLKFNMEELENKAIAGPVDELLVRYGTTYWELLGNARVADPFEAF